MDTNLHIVFNFNHAGSPVGNTVDAHQTLETHPHPTQCTPLGSPDRALFQDVISGSHQGSQHTLTPKGAYFLSIHDYGNLFLSVNVFNP
jgi:hypothetical protein